MDLISIETLLKRITINQPVGITSNLRLIKVKAVCLISIPIAAIEAPYVGIKIHYPEIYPAALCI